MWTRSSADDVFDDAQGFLRSAVLACSVRAGVFDALDSGRDTVAELATATKLDARTARAVLDALVAMGYAVRRGTRYGLCKVSKECLVRGTQEYMGDAVELVAHPAIWSAMGRFAELHSRGASTQTASRPWIDDSAEYWIDFAKRSDWLVRPVAAVMAKTLKIEDLREETWILDVGCGSGRCALTLVAANPHVNAILIDRPEVLAIASEHAKQFGITDRVTMLPGDALEVHPTREVDIVIVSLLLHHLDLGTCTRLLRRLRGCMKNESRILIHDYLRDTASPGEASVAMLAAVMAVCTGGDIHTLDDYRRILAECGFQNCSVHEALPDDESWLVMARRG